MATLTTDTDKPQAGSAQPSEPNDQDGNQAREAREKGEGRERQVSKPRAGTNVRR